MEYPSLSTPPSGSIRFNTDSKRLEIYNGEAWWGMDGTSPEVHTGGTRGLAMGGYNGSSLIDIIEYVQINTAGNAVDFGNLAAGNYEAAALGSRTRGIYWGGGPTPTTMQYITFASTGNAATFGTCTAATQSTGLSDATRGISIGGWASPTAVNTIEYITIAATGNSVDFGDMVSKRRQTGAFSSPTRGIAVGGSPMTNSIDYITISSTGNAADFGDLNAARQSACSASNAIRGVFAGGDGPALPAVTNSIEYIAIPTLGNGIDFGDLSVAHSFVIDGGASSSTRAIFMGGYANPGPAATDVIDCVEIMTTGNANDFGDLSGNRNRVAACSNGHGGLG